MVKKGHFLRKRCDEEINENYVGKEELEEKPRIIQTAFRRARI